MFIAMIFFTAQSGIIKELGQTLHVTQIVVIRQWLMVLLLFPPLLKSTKGHLKINRKDLLLMRSCLTFVSILAGLTAIIELPLATATTLSFTKTFFLTVFAILILKETVGPRRIGALVVGFLGILIIARPAELLRSGIDINITLSLLSAAAIAANQIIVRIHLRYDTPTLIVASQAFIIGVAMIPLAYFHWIPLSWNDFFWIAVTAGIASFAQWMMVHAFKRAETTALAPFDYMRLILSTIVGWYMFNEWPDAFTWIGAAIIFASTFYIMRREAKLEKAKALAIE